MDIEKLIERMNSHLQSLAAYSDPELAHTLEDAATALSTLKDENKSLRVLVELGNTRAKDYRVMRDRAVKAEAENEKLRETVDKYATAARVIALHLKPFCDESLTYDEMIADAARKASDELEQVKQEMDYIEQDFRAFAKQWWEEDSGFPCRWCKFERQGGCEWKAIHPGEICAGRAFEWRGQQKED